MQLAHSYWGIVNVLHSILCHFLPRTSGTQRHETKLLSGLTPGALVLKHRCIIFPCWHFIGPLKFVFLMPHFHPLDDISISGQSRPLQGLLLSHGHFSTLHNSVPAVSLSLCQPPLTASCPGVYAPAGTACQSRLAYHLGWWNWVTVQGVHSTSQVLCVLHPFAFILHHTVLLGCRSSLFYI